MGKGSRDTKDRKSPAGGKKVVTSLAEALKRGPSGGVGGSSRKSSTKKGTYQKSWAKFATNGKKCESDSMPTSETVHQETDKKKKKELKQQRASAKPNFELVNNMKASWNKVRDRSTSEEERKFLVSQMMNQIKGNVLQVTLRHDASRMTQCILQYGTEEQRTQVLDELLEKSAEVAKTPYGHFSILKAISYCTGPTHQKKICASIKGHFVALGTNVVGARIVESILIIYPSKMSRSLKAEFYGKFTILLAEPPRNLQELLSQSTSGKEGPILDHMEGLIQRFMDKGLLDFRYVHELVWEYCQALMAILADASGNGSGADAGERQKRASKRLDELTGSLVDFSDRLMVSKPGARTLCHLASHGGAKERKRIIKALKGKTLEALSHEAGHLVVMRLVDVTDDTVTIQKSLLDEMKVTDPTVKLSATGHVVAESLVPPLLKVATSPYGKKFLLRLLLGSGGEVNNRDGEKVDLVSRGRGGHLEPDEGPLFLPTQPVSSKKPFATRRKEHLVYFRQALLVICTTYTSQLLRSPSGAAVLEAVFVTYNDQKVSAAICNAFAGQKTHMNEERVVDRKEDFDNYEGQARDNDDDDESTSSSDSQDDDEGRNGWGMRGKRETGRESSYEESSDKIYDDNVDDKDKERKKKNQVEVGPLEEIRSAFQCLRHLLQRENWLRSSTAEEPKEEEIHAMSTGKSDQVGKDWDTNEVCPLAAQLIATLNDAPSTTTTTRLEKWSHSNRGCTLLALAAQADETALIALRSFFGGANTARLEPARALLTEGTGAEEEDVAGASRGPQALFDALSVSFRDRRKRGPGVSANGKGTVGKGTGSLKKKRRNEA